MYIFGTILAFLSLVIYAPANILDSYLSNRFKSKLPLVVLFNSLIPVILCPILLIWGIHTISFSILWVIIAIGLIETLYQFPYLRAFQLHDTSSVTSLFAIGRIFIPLFAFLMVGERITISQYIGFFIIILTSILLTYSRKEPLRLNKAFFYMTAVSFGLAIQSVLYKYLFEYVEWATGFFTVTLVAGISALIIFIILGEITDLVEVLKNKRAIVALTIPNILSWIGESFATLAVSLIPVTVAKGINSTHPLVVFGFSYITAKYFPSIINKSHKDIFTRDRVFIYILMVLGVILVV
jgi:drug/metabolite transporter (DMT)-like permease